MSALDDIFELRPLLLHYCCKISAVTEYEARRQILCLVSEDNDVVLRYTSEGGQEVLKRITWFRRTNRVIHDVSFDPTGTWLVVLCFDNTLHIVPALAIVDKTFAESASAQAQQSFSTTSVTSYIIPFVGPHECPNSKKCPNNNAAQKTKHKTKNHVPPPAAPSASEEPTAVADEADKNVQTLKQSLDHMSLGAESEKEKSLQEEKEEDTADLLQAVMPTDFNLEAFSQDISSGSAINANVPAQPEQSGDQAGNTQVMGTSFMASNTCPYPLSVVWWQTIDGANRAIIGYSDGSICFVALSPNCPFVASTAIQSGSVMKLLICKDITFESVMLLITSSLKQQYKLLLEQKAIKYVYPGDISPSTAQGRESDWQIVMPVKANNSNSSDPASDSSQLEEDVFSRNEETSAISAMAPLSAAPAVMSMQPSAAKPTPPSLPPKTNNPMGTHGYVCTSQLPPPPPYSVAISRHVESGPSTTTAGASSSCGVRFQQQQLSDYSDLSGRGILPAARARLTSLKNLGSKKINEIKSRLSDNRQKLEEYIPESTLGSFAIIDSPSLTPELLGNSTGSFYTIQNLRSTYLLSALHSQSNSLSVHRIDISLKPVFLYKIPKNCFDILISSNLLYSIQYVDIKAGPSSTSQNEEREKSEQKETESAEKKITDSSEGKQGKYGDAKLTDAAETGERNKSATESNNGPESVDTSATTSGPSSNTCLTPSNLINAVGVISSAMASIRTGGEEKFNAASQLSLFRFENETVLNLYQMATYRPNEIPATASKEEKAKAFYYKDIRSPHDYIQFYKTADVQDEYSMRQMEILQNEFPKINYDPCYVVTNKNVYYIQLNKEPFEIFLDAALASDWIKCRQFCNTFDISYETCIEFAGDYLLRRRKITQALLTYNTARTKPLRTALKLAMFGQTCALMHLCGMALKMSYVLKSKYFCHPIVKTILNDITYRHSEDVRSILPPNPATYCNSNEGTSCGNYVYGVDESISSLQMLPSSQFHLANLLLITLAEKAVNDKNYIPLWNFLVTNTKYHTNMTSIVLCQSGLFSAALILTKARGVCIDTFLALTSVMCQEFGWYSELNVCLYHLSEPLFTETITYMPYTAVEYFNFIQEKLQSMHQCVLRRLEQQLYPFSPVLRPIVSHTSSGHTQHNSEDNNTFLFDFCTNLIETYLAVLIHLESQRTKCDRITNALSNFRITYEDNQFAIESSRFKPISAGCAHCACVVDGVAYFWGSNGVPCSYSASKSSEPPDPPYAVKSLDLLSRLNIEVHAVKCGRQHTLVLTNNGLYSFGNNNLYQLGIGRELQVSLQPMLIKELDGKNITVLEAGQYHNAAVADGFLYTWGWGVYGQLGHGDTENVSEPKLVSFFANKVSNFKFFANKKVIQVSLGHAHSLVLCQHGESDNQTELYVFGSNHFGQLGIGDGTAPPNADKLIDELHCGNQVKSEIPMKLEVGTARIRLIHTKFFTNLVVDENEQMYCWGSSPQALRLANQIKRRANAKQKIEEQQRREINKRFESTMDNLLILNDDASDATTTLQAAASKTEASSLAEADISKVDESGETMFAGNVPETEDAEHVPAESSALNDTVVRTSTTAQIVQEVVEELVGSLKPLEALPLLPPTATVKPTASSELLEEKKIEFAEHKQISSEAEPCDHMSPQLVDTAEIAGQILQVSSGLFHFALISSSCTLYTWGKNLEHQLGTEDKERRAVNKPSPIDSIERPMYVDCGADFTLVMTTDFIVKAFGGNSNGQCGRDLGATLDKAKQRVVCLPATKRLMRFESQCVDAPVEINLPRPRIHLDPDPVRYLKFIPRFQKHFIQEADIDLDDGDCDRPSSSQQYKSTTQADSSENTVTGQESDDLVSSLENLSNDASNPSLNPSYNFDAINMTEDGNNARLPASDQRSSNPPEAAEERRKPVGERSVETDCDELQELRYYIHYCLYVFHGLYNPDKVREFSKSRLEYRIRTLMLNFKFIDAFKLCLQDCYTSRMTLKIFEYFTKDTGYVPMRRQDLKFLIYYLILHFLERKFDMLECEQFFLNDLDFYLLELAYVLYFNNNNTVLEQDLNQKFKSLLAQEDSNQNEHEHKLEETDALFDSLSVKFKAIICQRLLKHCST